MPRFQDIPQFTRNATYAVDVSWQYLPSHYLNAVKDYHLNVYPDFQRNYVWTESQKVRYVEFILRGGSTGRNIYCNCPNWKFGKVGSYVLVDGRQRLDAVFGFMNNEFAVLGGNYFRDYTDSFRLTGASFRWHVNDLETRDEVLQWYLDLNTGGTVHTDEELNRVRGIIGTGDYVEPSLDEIMKFANLDREPIQRAMADADRRQVVPVIPEPAKSKVRSRKRSIR